MTVQSRNPNVISWTDDSPYGYTDPGPFYLEFNTTQEAWDDPNMRAALSYVIENSAELIQTYRKKFGLDGSLWDQYVSYLASAVRFDFGRSLTSFPRPVSDIILDALPFTFVLLTVSLLISFTLGTLLGALIVWFKIGRIGIGLVAPLLLLGSIPYYLLAIILLFVFRFALQWFPSGGARSSGASSEFTSANFLDVARHGDLPVMSIVLASAGGWLIGLCSMTITVTRSDYLVLAQAKGRSQLRIFYHYVIRNAILPQVTYLAIAMGNIVGGAILVEVILNYPGSGSHLLRAISNQDFTLIQGMTYILAYSVARAGTDDAILSIRDLHVQYTTAGQTIHAVRGVNLDIRRGERFGIAGESGSGKTTLINAILRLLPPTARITKGSVTFNDIDLTRMDNRSLNTLRWTRIALIPQGSMSSLNPIMKVGHQIADVILTHEGKRYSKDVQARIETSWRAWDWTGAC